MSFHTVLEHYRNYSFSERDKGDRFERLIQAYLQTDPTYVSTLKYVWMWNEFPGKADFGGKDTGIDVVALTYDGEYWAIQCKCYAATGRIDKAEVDSFLSTSSRDFKNEQLQTTSFARRIWVSTTNNWSSNAEETIKNQNPPVSRINLTDLEQAPVNWETLQKGITGDLARTEKKTLRLHQQEAVEESHEHFQSNDRGKLIMACGTGKTFTSLRIAEKETNNNGLVLFLVPSIALLGQTLREWSSDAEKPIKPIAICSDARITRQRGNTNDDDDFSVVDLAFPASTDVKSVIKQFRNINREAEDGGMTVVFSTYQSIDVIANAQRHLLNENNSNAIFDLIICDEAHRTTGVTLAGNDESAFVKVHNNDFLQAKRRLYMTATPRLFSDDSKSKADLNDAELCSMDDEEKYGTEIYRIGFGEAVDKGLLTDYKVLVLTLSENDVPTSVQRMVANPSNEINSDDASKLIGCLNALSKQVLGDNGLIKDVDPEPMKRAVAFCQNIKVSKRITNTFNDTSEVYLDSVKPKHREKLVSVSSKHIDGSMNAPQRDELLGWLKSQSADSNECRILTNVRCLSEGVDVPSLDAVLFLSARNSEVDVVQSVGRVMRRAPGKKYGYIIIPVVIPSNVEPSEALNDNERFKVVWTVLNALRAHDDRFNSTINKINLNKNKPSQILVGGIPGYGTDGVNEPESKYGDISEQFALQFEELQSVVYAKMVQKVGDRVYWEKWAKDVAQIAENQIDRINNLIARDESHRAAFDKFLNGLRKNINPSISESQAVDMLSQHIITKPVFEALFEGYSFVKNNAISSAMQSMLDILESQAIGKETETLEKFYEKVKMRAEGIDNAEGKQRIIIELYDKFFKTAFPKMVEQLGIVYTPVEVVDFIIYSVNDVLQKEFGRTVSDENVHILDPFTGTGTFITRLLQSGLIKEEDLLRKYTTELHANEIVLLAYYIAAVNIENAFHDQTPDPDDGIGKETYVPFDGIVLTDTFQLGESDHSEKLFSEMFPQNSKRVQAQQKAPLRVIMGNPPYSIGQKSANDNAQNQSYDKLNSRISNTYAALSNAGLSKSLYDAYIKAFRWSTDRLDPENGGVIAFVSNGAWLDGNSTDGFRKSLEKEFSSVYVFNLRGNQRTSGELSRKEGGKIFGSGSRTPISITLLVKNPEEKGPAKIYYHDIGDYLSREEKLQIVADFQSLKSLDWKRLKSNEHGDWINKRNEGFQNFLPIQPAKKLDLKAQSFFNNYGVGINTARDAWSYNFSRSSVEKNMSRMIDFYNEQRVELRDKFKDVKSFSKALSGDTEKISWSVNLKKDAFNNKERSFDNSTVVISSYRPYCKQYLYFDRPFIERPGVNSTFYPESQYDNITICVSPSQNDGLSLLISNNLTNLHFNGDTQCFPLYYYEKKEQLQGNLFDGVSELSYVRKDGVSDFIWERAKKQYGKSVTKEDIFFYVYGVLHSPEYRETFANDLKKMLPRIPLVDRPKDFKAFSDVGRKLADLHINYEAVEPYPGVEVEMLSEQLKMDSHEFFKVTKLRFPKKDQKNCIIYNSRIKIHEIPEQAYEYVVNGKSAIEWIMDRYQVKVDKKSGIKNDPNDWSKEVNNPRYILDLLLSIINVSVQTVELVENLPKLELADASQGVEVEA